MLDIDQEFQGLRYRSNPSRGKTNTDKSRPREKLPTSDCPALNSKSGWFAKLSLIYPAGEMRDAGSFQGPRSADCKIG